MTETDPSPVDIRTAAVRTAADSLRTRDPGTVLDIIDLAYYVETGRRPGDSEPEGPTLAQVMAEKYSRNEPELAPQPIQVVEGHLDEAAIRTDQARWTTGRLIRQLAAFNASVDHGSYIWHGINSLIDDWTNEPVTIKAADE